VLCAVSFADVLNEDVGEGYQGPRNRQHSTDSRGYISGEGTSTVPLVFNLRDATSESWDLAQGLSGMAKLCLRRGAPSLAQADCQHRLSELYGMAVALTVMAFVGLSFRMEMALFNVINTKAKGLSPSLPNFHDSLLVSDVVDDASHLYIAQLLNEDTGSPRHRLVRYGGESTPDLRRRTSLRMLQRTVHHFIRSTETEHLRTVQDYYAVIVAFWWAVQDLFGEESNDHRHRLLTEGTGFYSLMMLLADLARGHNASESTTEFLPTELSPLRGRVVWGSSGTFAQAGGHKRATDVCRKLKELLYR